MNGRTDDDARRDLDARFLLANERTLLAWTRTALAFMAGGAALAQAATDLHGRIPLAAVSVGVGVAAAVVGAVRYRRMDTALREGRLPAARLEPYALAAVLALVGIALLVTVLVAG